MIDLYVRAHGKSGCLLTVATSESGVAFTVAKGERTVTSIVVPWDDYWKLMRDLNSCERAFIAASLSVVE